MIIKQVRFRCVDESAYFGGILIKDREQAPYVICGCCGGVMEMDNIAEIEEFKGWADISDEIIENYHPR